MMGDTTGLDQYVKDDRSRLDSLRAWLASDPPAVYLADDVRWAVRTIEDFRPDPVVSDDARRVRETPASPPETSD